jgi:hypothetical protein
MNFDYLKSSGHNCIFAVNCKVQNNILKAGFAHVPARLTRSHQTLTDENNNLIKVIIPSDFINLKNSIFKINLELNIYEHPSI